MKYNKDLTKVLQFRVSDQMITLIDIKAKEQSISKSNYIRSCIKKSLKQKK